MANAKRVLLLVTTSDWGGVQAFLVRFAKELKEQGWDVMLAAGGKSERLREEAIKAGLKENRLVRLKYMKREVNPFFDWLAYREIKKLIDDFQPAVVHLNSSKMGAVGSFASHRSKTRPWTVYRIGGWAFLEKLSEHKIKLYKYIERRTGRYKDVIITVHPKDKDLAIKENILPKENLDRKHLYQDETNRSLQADGKPEKRIVCIPNGIDFYPFRYGLKERPIARKILDLPEDAYIFGTVANVYPPKALEKYVKSLNDILPSMNAHAVIVGGGPGFKNLKNIVSTLENKRFIHLPGGRSDAATLYRAFDAFVLPSEKEGMPWSLLEAMAAKLPCVATDVGACHWMLLEVPVQLHLGPAGVIIPPQNEMALKHTMTVLRYSSSDLAMLPHGENLKVVDLGQAAATTVEKYFTWRACFSMHLQMIEDKVFPG